MIVTIPLLAVRNAISKKKKRYNTHTHIYSITSKRHVTLVRKRERARVPFFMQIPQTCAARLSSRAPLARASECIRRRTWRTDNLKSFVSRVCFFFA